MASNTTLNDPLFYVVLLTLGRYCNGCLKRKDSTKYRFLLMKVGNDLPDGWCVFCVMCLHRISHCSRLKKYYFMTLTANCFTKHLMNAVKPNSKCDPVFRVRAIHIRDN
jgi:hypothetical protein